MLEEKNDLNTNFDNLIEKYLINLINFKLIGKFILFLIL